MIAQTAEIAFALFRASRLVDPSIKDLVMVLDAEVYDHEALKLHDVKRQQEQG